MTSPSQEPMTVELPLEERFTIQKYAVQAKTLSHEQLESTLVELLTISKLTEKVYQNMLKNAWGL